MTRGCPAIGGLVLLSCLFFPAQAAAQVTGGLDAGISDVRYDLFRTSWAASITPTLQFRRGWTSLTARGTWLRFESGHRSLSGAVFANAFTPSAGPWRGEVAIDAGASRYLSLPTFSHIFGAGRLHFLTPRHGFWAGATVGNAVAGTLGRQVARFDAGLWIDARVATMTVTAAHNSMGDTVYTDFQGLASATRGIVELDGLLGARVWSRDAGRGVYGEASAVIHVAPRLAVLIGAGRYPTDPTRGSIAGRYLTAALRVSTAAFRPRALPADDPALPRFDRSAPPGRSSVRLDLGPLRAGLRTVRIHAPPAHRVEIIADFTDWQPVVLERKKGDVWEVDLPMAPGPHHLEVRVDGGAWRPPAGTTPVLDDFGGETGLLVVP